jgi:hypothetical protein
LHTSLVDDDIEGEQVVVHEATRGDPGVPADDGEQGSESEQSGGDEIVASTLMGLGSGDWE